tara:strand:+ start:400 stop:912 length:513 start_codon:yes stop_codon:yes gene_type:complete
MEVLEVAQLVTGISTLIVASVLIWQMVIQKRTLDIAHNDADSSMTLSAIQIHSENRKWFVESTTKATLEKMKKGLEYLDEIERLHLDAHITNLHFVLSAEWRLGRRGRLKAYYKLMYYRYGLMEYKASREVLRKVISGTPTEQNDTSETPGYDVAIGLLDIVKEIYEEDT